MRIIKTSLSIFLAVLLTNCTTSEKIMVSAPAGTKIYLPGEQTVPYATVQNEAPVKVLVSSNMYCGYLLAQPQNSDVQIPLGVNFKQNDHNGTRMAVYTGLPLIPALVGIAYGTPAIYRFDQLAYNYNFSYVEQQKLEIPHLSNTLLKPNPPKVIIPVEQRDYSRKKASSGEANNTNVKESGSTLVKSRIDNARKVEGSYFGNGTLSFRHNIEEKYSDIQVQIERIDRSHVSVRIVENGEDYFNNTLTYIVQSDSSGGLKLKIEDIPEAIIHITENGKLTFKHPKVNIDGEIYMLEISAQK